MFSERIADALCRHVGETNYLAFVFVLMLLVPAALVVWAWRSWSHRRGPPHGAFIGLAVGCWASLCNLCVPYVGLYPNLPGGLLALAVAGPGADATAAGQVCIHAANLVLWPSLGWLAFSMRPGAKPA